MGNGTVGRVCDKLGRGFVGYDLINWASYESKTIILYRVFYIRYMGKKLDEYNCDSAFHYKSYRPPLHEFLLDIIFKEQTFNNILDIGCGTGNSSIALTKFGESVTGYDPSKPMIHNAQKHSKINYTFELNQLIDNYGLIVFFGSLFYVDDKSLLFYQNKLSKEGFLLCCDFQILYEPILSKLGVCENEIEYDHSTNLDSHNTNSFELINSEKFETEFSCQLNELIHLLLSESHIKTQLNKKYEPSNIFKNLREELMIHYPQNEIKINSSLFYSYYRKIS